MTAYDDLTNALNAASVAASGMDDELNQANADRDAAEQAEQTAQGQLAAVEATLAQAKADLAQAKSDLDACRGTTTPPPPPPPPANTVFLGSSFGGMVGPSKVRAGRIYDWNDGTAIQRAVAHGVTRLSLSSRDDTKDGATVVSRIKATFTKYPQITEIDYAHENEADRSDHRGGSTADMQAWAGECKKISDAIYAATFPSGKGVKFATDFTIWGMKQGISQKMMGYLKSTGCKVEVFGASMYPPGREKTPPVVSPLADFLHLPADVAAQYGIKYISCYEIATPLSSTYDRPSYVATWAPEFKKYAESKGLIPRDFDYWDDQKSGDVDNRFGADGSTATVVGKTEKAFFASLG